jgi:hypothetical protein
MSVVLATLANAATTTTTTATTIELSAADAFGGFVALIVGILSFLSISGMTLHMTLTASKSASTMAITAIAGLISVLIVVGFVMTLSAHHALKLEGCPAETWDRIGGTLAMIIGVVGLLALVGILATSTIAVFSANKAPVSSWPTELEGAFAGFDRRIQAAQSRAWMFSIGAGVLTFLFVFGVYQGVTPDMKDLAKDMNMSNLNKKSKAEPKSEAPAKEAAPKQEAPKQEAPKAEKAGEKAEKAE